MKNNDLISGRTAFARLFHIALIIILVLPASTVSANPAAPPAASPTPHPGMSALPPASFDPKQFPAITSSTLPQENGEPVVMRVNGHSITWDDFIAQVRMTGTSVYAQHPDKEAHIAAALAGPIRERLILQALYADFAAENHLAPEVREIQNRAAKLIEARDPRTAAAIDRLSREQIQQVVKADLTKEKVDKFLGDRATSAPPTMAELKEFVELVHPTTHPLTVLRARHIVVRATPDMTEFNINDAEARAEEIRTKINDIDTTSGDTAAAERSFRLAAMQYSQDRFTAYLGGDLGFFRAGTMYPAVNEALKKLQPGEVSPVIRTPVGFHIFQLTRRLDDDLVLQHQIWKRAQAVAQWQTSAAEKAKIENYLE